MYTNSVDQSQINDHQPKKGGNRYSKQNSIRISRDTPCDLTKNTHVYGRELVGERGITVDGKRMKFDRR